jgi:glyoxylase-like metal-dependent hydrolase (beta-lactamase superfamily II)
MTIPTNQRFLIDHYPSNVHIIDLDFQNFPSLIAVFAIEHADGLILVECGPASALPRLIQGIEKIGYSIRDVTDVLLTHIHLDHAGAAGTLSKLGIHIHVHSKGIAHLIEPDKLIASATRIYGDQMPVLWGNTQPVSPEKIHALSDGDKLTKNGIQIQTIETPGHADHHNAYIYHNICFTGDICGIHIINYKNIVLPTPPPEFHIEKWINSIETLSKLDVKYLALTHFGLFYDAKNHLNNVANLLSDLNRWIDELSKTPLTFETLSNRYYLWIKSHVDSLEKMDLIERINPSIISASGIYRFLQKYRCQ